MAFFARFGQMVVFFGRLVPVVRSLISIPAGMNRMPMGAFLLSTTLGTVLWNGLLAVIGLVLGEHWQAVLDLVKQYEKMTLLALAGLTLAFFYLRLRGTRAATRLPEEE
jgi:membrane protein DedA with SNARE-associated domain